jgi:hypothetical protein
LWVLFAKYGAGEINRPEEIGNQFFLALGIR